MEINRTVDDQKFHHPNRCGRIVDADVDAAWAGLDPMDNDKPRIRIGTRAAATFLIPGKNRIVEGTSWDFLIGIRPSGVTEPLSFSKKESSVCVVDVGECLGCTNGLPKIRNRAGEEDFWNAELPELASVQRIQGVAKKRCFISNAGGILVRTLFPQQFRGIVIAASARKVRRTYIHAAE